MDARRVVLVGCLFLLLPAAASAQALGSIAGTVRDPSGAVLPGVTVEAASPALIEKVRTAVSDGQGVFRITELRPGPYTVTFTLPGFSTFVRDGIELTTGFTATVNAELSVGALEETVTVTGAAPLVDTQSVGRQTVFSQRVVDALPTTSNTNQFAVMLPGANVLQARRMSAATRANRLRASRFRAAGAATS